MQGPHYIFKDRQWATAYMREHPKVQVTISVDRAQAHGESTSVRATNVTAIADTGAQVNVWSLDEFVKYGFPHDILTPASNLVAANHTRAPQGFLSSGDGYNRRFAAILSDFMRKERCVDDTVFFDENLEEHWWRTIQFLTLVGRSGIVLNPSKFQFAQRSVDFAGFCISESCVEPLPKYLNAIQQFSTPKNIKDIRNLFGLINQVANYPKIRDLMAPFKPFFSPKRKFEWNNNLDKAFLRSKDAIIDAIRHGVEIFDPT